MPALRAICEIDPNRFTQSAFIHSYILVLSIVEAFVFVLRTFVQIRNSQDFKP